MSLAEVLIVDDDKLIRRFLSPVLWRVMPQMREAATGNEGLAATEL